MTRISPAQRSLKERGNHRIANIAMVLVMAAFVGSAIWLFGGSTRSNEVDDNKKTTDYESATTSNKSAETATSHIAKLVPQLNSIKRTIPNRRFAFVPDIDAQFDEAASDLAKLEPKLTADSHFAPTFSDLLHDLNLQAEELASPVIPKVVSSQAESYRRIFDDATKLTSFESTTIALAVKTALDEKRQTSERMMRPVKLALRQRQDEVTMLRERIATLQSELEQIRHKEERAAALKPLMNEVHRYLTPFTSPGYVQPAGNSISHNVERTVDAKPVSLDALRKIGALERTMEGFKCLLVFGGGRGPVHANRRPLGSFPAYKNWNALATPDILNTVKRAQSLIRDHGEALVEAQLLSP